MRRDRSTDGKAALYTAGVLPVWWLALLSAPYLNSGLAGLIDGFSEAMSHPFRIQWCDQSIKVLMLMTMEKK